MYAIIEDSGTQIKVSEGDVIMVAIRELPANVATITFDRVLMVGGQDGATAQVGAPWITGARVTGDILAQGRTPRVDIWKFRRRKNYKRHRGHRQDFLSVKITGIQS